MGTFMCDSKSKEVTMRNRLSQTNVTQIHWTQRSFQHVLHWRSDSRQRRRTWQRWVLQFPSMA